MGDTADHDGSRSLADERERRYRRLDHFLEWPMAVLAAAVVPALLIEGRGSSPALREAGNILNWIIWFAFCAEFLAKLALAPERTQYIRTAWLNLIVIVLAPPFLVPESFQLLRSLRAVRFIRLLRLVRASAAAVIAFRLVRRVLQHQRFHYVGAVAVATVILGAIGVHSVESGVNPNVKSFGDAIWWAVVTVTTVGYGDVSPVTTEGRLIAVLLMLTGIAVIGVFTATVASFFFDSGQQDELAQLKERMREMDAKLDVLIAAVKGKRDG